MNDEKFILWAGVKRPTDLENNYFIGICGTPQHNIVNYLYMPRQVNDVQLL